MPLRLLAHETYFRQLTAEFLAETATRGRTHKFWKIRGGQRDNHFLDTRIMNMALAEHLGLSSLTADEWAGLAKERGSLPDDSLPLLKTPGAPPAGNTRPPVARAPDALDALGEMNKCAGSGAGDLVAARRGALKMG